MKRSPIKEKTSPIHETVFLVEADGGVVIRFSSFWRRPESSVSSTSGPLDRSGCQPARKPFWEIPTSRDLALLRGIIFKHRDTLDCGSLLPFCPRLVGTRLHLLRTDSSLCLTLPPSSFVKIPPWCALGPRSQISCLSGPFAANIPFILQNSSLPPPSPTGRRPG